MSISFPPLRRGDREFSILILDPPFGGEGGGCWPIPSTLIGDDLDGGVRCMGGPNGKGIGTCGQCGGTSPHGRPSGPNPTGGRPSGPTFLTAPLSGGGGGSPPLITSSCR